MSAPGPIAQLEERLNGIEEVVGSSPTGSTKFGGVYRAEVAGAEVRIAWEPESNRAPRASQASRRKIGPAQGR